MRTYIYLYKVFVGCCHVYECTSVIGDSSVPVGDTTEELIWLIPLVNWLPFEGAMCLCFKVEVVS